jgi:hypothetical protein
MKDFNSEPSDPVRVTIPRWIYDRIAVLLVAANGGEKPSGGEA